MMNRRLRLGLVALLATLSSACTETTQPVERPTADLHFLRLATNAPPIKDTTVSFWARTDADREVIMRYAATGGGSDGDEFLRFTVPAGALASRPDGTPFAARDSVLITIRIVDFSRLIIDFQPARLTFSRSQPAQLRISFGHCDQDFNGDGVTDSQDAQIATQISLWRQELPTEPWFKLGSILNLESDEAEASVFGFTGYALAY